MWLIVVKWWYQPERVGTAHEAPLLPTYFAVNCSRLVPGWFKRCIDVNLAALYSISPLSNWVTGNDVTPHVLEAGEGERDILWRTSRPPMSNSVEV